MSLCNNLLPHYQNLCPKCTQWFRCDVTAGSDINDQLINNAVLVNKLNVFWAY